MALTIECDGCPRCGSASEPVRIADCTAHPRWSAALPREIAWDRCLRCGHVHTRDCWSPEGIDFMTAALAPPLDVLSLMDVLERSDVVVMAAPLTAETRSMLGAAEFARMKPSAYFINVGRGATVDEGALARALRDGRLAGAAIDVFAQEPPSTGHPFYALDNVILSPHVSGFLASYDERCSELFAENLRRYLEGAPLLNQVDRAKGY